MNAPNLPDAFTCQQAFALLYEYLDKALDGDELRLVEEHLAICEGCTHHFAFEEKLLDQVREKCRSTRAPEGLRRKITQLLDQL